MIPVTGYEDRKVGVLGLGRSGLAAAEALKEGGAEPVIWDDGEAARDKAAAAGWAVADLARPREAAEIALLVVSPGIPHLYPEPHPAVARALDLGTQLDNEVGLFFRAMAMSEEEPPKIVCVTGSNGKSTTTALIAHLLAEAGRPVQMGGNIGRAVLDLEPPDEDGIVVLELSSYQTELASMLAPDIAVFLNLSPDHLGRHGGIGGYFAAKRRLFEAGAPERAVICLDDLAGRFLASRVAEGTLLPIAAARKLKADDGWSVFMAKNHLTEWRSGRQMTAIDLRTAPALIGRHNHQNACAAYAAVRALGLAPRTAEAGLASFPGLAHRLERLGTVRGIPVVNDSKATNADAAARALESFPRIRWIAGGRAKEGGIAALGPLLDRVAKAYLIGEDAPGFADTLAASGTEHAQCGDLSTATAQALAEAGEGEAVVFSPAAASFDQFTDFEARGEAFRALVAPHLEPSP